MADYEPKLVKEYEVRNFFSPPLSYDDISKAELLLKIEAIERFIADTYFDGTMPSRDDAKIPALLLVISQIVQNPNISKKYNVLLSEKLGDYSYRISDKYGKEAYNAYAIYREMALAMLRAKSGKRYFRLEKSNAWDV